MDIIEYIREIIPEYLYRLAQVLELVVSAVVAVAICWSIYAIFGDFGVMMDDPAMNLDDFLALAFNIIIGIELLKMLCRHSVGAVVEVLLFALARGLVIDHGGAVENLVTVAAIGLLFVVRKYLFIPELDGKHHILQMIIGKKKKAEDSKEESATQEDMAVSK